MGPASPLSHADLAWQAALSRPLPPSPGSMSPSRPRIGHVWRPTAKPKAVDHSLSADQLSSKACDDMAAAAWDESDDDTWESESFESTLSSIAAFDMEGALERMRSGENFYTPELADSAASPPPSAGDKQTSPCDDWASRCYVGDEQAPCSACLGGTSSGSQGNALPGAQKGSDNHTGTMAYQGDQAAVDGSHGAEAVRAALTLSSDSEDGLQVISWTAGRSMNRRHVLDTPESDASHEKLSDINWSPENSPLAARGSMRKLVLPHLVDCRESPQQRTAGSAAAAQHSAPEQSTLRTLPHTSESVSAKGSGARSASSGSATAEQWQGMCCGKSSSNAQTGEDDSLEPFRVRLPATAHNSKSRTLRILDDSDTQSESQCSGKATAEWDSDSCGSGASPCSSSVEALSSGLRTAIRQLGSSYRLRSAVLPDTRPSSRRRGSNDTRAAPVSDSETCTSPQQAISKTDHVYDLSDSEDISPQRMPLAELEGKTWAFAAAGSQGNAPFQMGRIGEVADPASPVWKGKTRVNFDLDGPGAQTMPTLPKTLPGVLGTPTHGGNLTCNPSTPKTAPKPFVPKTPSKSRPAKTPVTVAAFRKRRSQLAASAFAEFNTEVFMDRLPADTEIGWSAQLKTTAGTTHFRREVPAAPNAGPRHTASVQLASKVIDTEAKLRATLLHELCHVATWVLPPHVAKPPHGPDFKRWANIASKAYPDLPVTTCHHYEIHVPFHYQCLNPECAFVYKRHSRSIDTDRMACGMCSGRLMFRGKFLPDGTPAKARAPNAFASFVKEQFAGVKAAHPAGTPHKVLMTALSAKWGFLKVGAEGTSIPDCTDLGVQMQRLQL